jgi:hypothetical protein
MTEQVTSNKSSLLLKIQKLNTQILQLFTKIIKLESIYKSISNAELDGLGANIPSGLIASGVRGKPF